MRLMLPSTPMTTPTAEMNVAFAQMFAEPLPLTAMSWLEQKTWLAGSN